MTGGEYALAFIICIFFLIQIGSTIKFLSYAKSLLKDEENTMMLDLTHTDDVNSCHCRGCHEIRLAHLSRKYQKKGGVFDE